MNQQGAVLRQFALAVCTFVFLFAALAYSQQIDVMIGGSTLESEAMPSSLATFHGPNLKNGIYPSISVDYVGFKKTRLGLNFETAWRYKMTDYPYNGETYRPIFNDVNAFFQPRFGKLFHREVGLDLWAGIGAATTIFDVPYASSCTLSSGCVTYPTSTHFMEDFGGGIRYRVWRKFFVRPEAHYYHIQNNFQFNSNNVFRIGASFGYTFGH
jgi:hypothetical protein